MFADADGFESPLSTTSGGMGHAYAGPERRRQAHPMALVLDAIDYGVVLLDPDNRVVHVNHSARALLGLPHPLRLVDGRLTAERLHDRATLNDAVDGARRRGLRSLLNLDGSGHRAVVSVRPLGRSMGGGDGHVLVLLGKRRVCEELTALSFGMTHGLTAAETRVLYSLCNGETPAELARRHGVKVSTARTQINSIRSKTGARNIDELIRRVATLPPLVGALRAPMPAAA